MTVCIAARCAGPDGRPGQAVVVAADRMMTGGAAPASMETQVVLSKIEGLSTYAVAGITGSANVARTFVADLRERLKGGATNNSSDALAEAIAKRYSDDRLVAMEREVFTARGLSIAGLYGGGNKDTAPMLASQIDKEAKEYSLGFDLLIGSVDPTGGHIHGVGYPARAYFYDADGFIALGQGAFVAKLLLGSAFRHSPAKTLNETIYHTYAAARIAEVVAGVGLGVDISIVTTAGVIALTDEKLAAVGQLFEQAELRSRDLLAAELPKLDLASPAVVTPASSLPRQNTITQ